MLCRSIVYQQLSGKAASTIMMRFLGLYDPAPLTPEALLHTTDDTLRGIGLSRQKIVYLKDLATQVQDGTLLLARLPMHSDAEVMHQLMGIKVLGAGLRKCFSFLPWAGSTSFLWTIWAFARPCNVPMATSDCQLQ